jgi:ATP-dependent Clp protease ATP-binding subunit ClpC
MFERYTERARRSLFAARARTVEREGDAITGEDLVGGILVAAPDTLAALASHPTDALTSGETPEAFWSRLQSAPAAHLASANREIPFSAAVKVVLERAVQEAEALGQKAVHPEHLVAALLREPESPAARLLLDAGITLAKVRQRLVTLRPPPD